MTYSKMWVILQTQRKQRIRMVVECEADRPRLRLKYYYARRAGDPGTTATAMASRTLTPFMLSQLKMALG